MADTPNDRRLFELEREHETIEAERRDHAARAGEDSVAMEPFFRRQDAVRREMRAITADTTAGVAAKLRVLNGMAPNRGETAGDEAASEADTLRELLRCADTGTMH